MITVYNAMLVTLGFLIAALVVLLIIPAYRRRIERFTTERLKRALPLTEAEIRADKDRIRAEFATEIHKLEMRLEDASVSAARQSVEINRREAAIQDLRETIEAQKTSVEENENARRVLEQAIVDRLPKVEQRLGEARRMLQKRDEEIALLADTSGKQTEALEQATQINAQLNTEVRRLTSALETRAARNREALGDPRFDGEVALRSEIEALRARSREQAELITRLQGEGKSGAKERGEGGFEVRRLSEQLAKTEAELLAMRAENEKRGGEGADRLRQLEADASEQAGEIERLKAALAAREDKTAADPGSTSNASDAEIGALKAEIEAQSRTIQRLKSEVAASNERLSRQTQHFRDEMRRLSASAHAEERSEQRQRTIEAARRSLAKRISEPRVPGASAELGTARSVEGETSRPAPYLKTINGGAAEPPDSPVEPDAVVQVPDQLPAAAGGGKPRRSRLLDRISNIDKQS